MIALGVVLFRAGLATATPSVTFRPQFVPIPGFPRTGNILGAGADLRVEYGISGSEYAASPPPLIGINLYLPRGSVLHSSGFPTCPTATLEQVGPPGCFAGAADGPPGELHAIVSSGTGRVEEPATLEAFHVPEEGQTTSQTTAAGSGALASLAVGEAPVPLRFLAKSRYTHLGGADGFGPELVTEIPLVSTVAGAPYASLGSLELKEGSAHKLGARPVYFSRVPRKCPKGGFPVEAEFVFDQGGAVPPVAEVVTAAYKMPCGRGRLPSQVVLTGTAGTVTAPSNRTCLRAGETYAVDVVQVKNVTYRHIDLEINGDLVAAVNRRLTSEQLTFRGLPEGRYTVGVTIVTGRRRRVLGTRTYQACAAAPQP